MHVCGLRSGQLASNLGPLSLQFEKQKTGGKQRKNLRKAGGGGGGGGGGARERVLITLGGGGPGHRLSRQMGNFHFLACSVNDCFMT